MGKSKIGGRAVSADLDLSIAYPHPRGPYGRHLRPPIPSRLCLLLCADEKGFLFGAFLIVLIFFRAEKSLSLKFPSPKSEKDEPVDKSVLSFLFPEVKTSGLRSD
ncbi:MAG: hypothetical protein AB1414_19320 [bacterium]